jgi:integrase
MKNASADRGVRCERRARHARVIRPLPWLSAAARHTPKPLKAVQELLGHATIDMTMRYAHLSPDVKRDAVRLLDMPPSDDAGAHVGHMES